MNIKLGISDPKLVIKHTSQSMPFLVPCVISEIITCIILQITQVRINPPFHSDRRHSMDNFFKQWQRRVMLQYVMFKSPFSSCGDFTMQCGKDGQTEKG